MKPRGPNGFCPLHQLLFEKAACAGEPRGAILLCFFQPVDLHPVDRLALQRRAIRLALLSV